MLNRSMDKKFVKKVTIQSTWINTTKKLTHFIKKYRDQWQETNNGLKPS